jgi:general secretion pathway protein F
MPLFQYKGLNSQQKKISGLFSAQNPADARLKLREKNILITELKEKKETTNTFSSQKIFEFTEQLSQLLEGGLPLHDSLSALEEQYRADPLHRVILHLTEQIQQGAKLSEALHHFKETFDNHFCAMIKAGEASGQLSFALKELHKLLKKKIRLRKDIIATLLYPAVLAIFSSLVIAMLLGYVIPSIEALFEGRSLNGFTEAILALSRHMRSYFFLYLVALSSSTVLLIFALKQTKIKRQFESVLLKMPLIKNILIHTSLCRFFTTLSSLQLAGVSTLEALKFAQNTITNDTVRMNITEATDKIFEGRSLSACLRETVYVPPLALRMLKVGEDSGVQNIMLERLANHYEEDLDKLLKNVMTLAQPLILIFMGAVIGAVLLAILLPLTDVEAFGF